MRTVCALLAWLCLGLGGTWISIRQNREQERLEAIGRGVRGLVHRILDGGLTMTQALEPLRRENGAQGQWADWVLRHFHGEAEEYCPDTLSEKVRGMLLPPVSLYDPEHALRLWQEEWERLLEENASQRQGKRFMAAKLGWALGAGLMLMML